MPAEILEATYLTWAALRRDCEGQLAMGALLLKTDVTLPQFSALTVKVVDPAGEGYELACQVLQVLPGQGLAVQVQPASKAEVARLRAVCEGREDDGEPPSSEEPEVARPSERKVSVTGTQLSLEPQELRRQLEAMTVNEKRQAALHCRREARLLLIKDMNKAVHPFVVKNPAITLDEIEQIAKMPSVNPDALRMIAANRDWTRSSGVCRALVKNPKTPLKEALAMLDKLPMGDVRALAKSSAVKTAIQQAARKKVNQ